MLLGAFATIALPVSAADDSQPFDPTSQYDVRVVDGWTLRINQRYADEPQLLDDVLAEMRRQFANIENAVPAPAVEKLRQIEIWVEINDPQFPCMCYHPNERWLKAHGVNPDKTKHVELANGRNFIAWTKQQPWMILHELAHGYHDRFIEGGYENGRIGKTLQRSTDAGLYGEVDHVGGKKRDHYAATNPMEYFAESSESYFGKNDFYPYNRDELRTYDEPTLLLMEQFWQVPVVASKPANDSFEPVAAGQ
jgi:hypothetical protein